ncbi:unnamed protein product [Clonostachys chloroleuca]|uniref:Uncharacterized protein n=1 Tax=Clonostachys chloroleuca TaxID=1926264 RepID=A0AA35PXY6_9HYPO|nr:unnamed protein product [Clonostachys chloroleuca]
MQLPQNQKATSSFSHRILEFQIPGWNMILAKFQQISTQRTPHKITVALTAFKRQLFTFDRPTYRNIAGEHYPDKDPIVDEEYPWYPIYRPEPLHVFQRLPEIRLSVLYIFGESSKLSPVQERENKMAHCGHLVPMGKVGECTAAITHFLGIELDRWKTGERRVSNVLEGKKPTEENHD